MTNPLGDSFVVFLIIFAIIKLLEG